MVTGLYNAFQDSVPFIAITGQHVRAMQGKEGFQAMDITEVVRPVVKKAYYVRESAQVPWVLNAGTEPPPLGSLTAGLFAGEGPSTPARRTPGPANEDQVMSMSGL